MLTVFPLFGSTSSIGTLPPGDWPSGHALLMATAHRTRRRLATAALAMLALVPPALLAAELQAEDRVAARRALALTLGAAEAARYVLLGTECNAEDCSMAMARWATYGVDLPVASAALRRQTRSLCSGDYPAKWRCHASQEIAFVPLRTIVREIQVDPSLDDDVLRSVATFFDSDCYRNRLAELEVRGPARDYGDAVPLMAVARSDAGLVAEVGDRWWSFRFELTPAPADLACRFHIRSMGYRIV